MVHSSVWRKAGMTYLDYVSVSSTSMRNVVKASLQKDTALAGQFFFRKQKWAHMEGTPAEGYKEKKLITNTDME